MPQFASETITAPIDPSVLLAGNGHHIADRTLEANLTLALGQVLGLYSANGRFAPLDQTVRSVTLSGDGSKSTFDLGHHSVAAETIFAKVDDVESADWTLSVGTGPDGVDQIVFASAPTSDTNNVLVRYQQSIYRLAGVLYQGDVVTGASEYPAMPVLQSGAVRRSKLVGLPAALNVTGNLLGLLILED
ncbi:MAG: hypothetical protein H7832_07680 [Magnetococcus sp. DMHC-6]